MTLFKVLQTLIQICKSYFIFFLRCNQILLSLNKIALNKKQVFNISNQRFFPLCFTDLITNSCSFKTVTRVRGGPVGRNSAWLKLRSCSDSLVTYVNRKHTHSLFVKMCLK